MFAVIRASFELMNEVMDCINSNSELYHEIVDPKDWSEHSVDETWAKRNFVIREFYLARDEGQFVGEASYQNLGNFAYIGYFYIKNQFLHQGYGSRLMQFMEMRARRDEIADMRLFCNPKAEWAVNFYTKLGFTVLSADKQEILAMDDGVMEPFYEEDAYFMQKMLPPPKPLSFSSEVSEEPEE
jgi:ribosomal protein S18 acetylase RimI-like enzyme